jgi:hypothetical protein
VLHHGHRVSRPRRRRPPPKPSREVGYIRSRPDSTLRSGFQAKSALAREIWSAHVENVGQLSVGIALPNLSATSDSRSDYADYARHALMHQSKHTSTVSALLRNRLTLHQHQVLAPCGLNDHFPALRLLMVCHGWRISRSVLKLSPHRPFSVDLVLASLAVCFCALLAEEIYGLQTPPTRGYSHGARATVRTLVADSVRG